MKFDIELLSILKEKREPCIVYSKDINLEQFGISEYVKLPFIGAVGAELDYESFNLIKNSSQVGFIARQNQVFTYPQKISEKKIFVADKRKNWGIFSHLNKGSIAIIDTGISPNLDFLAPRKRLLCFKDFVEGKGSAYDDNGHGTFIASVACANGLSSARKVVGSAESAGIVALKAIGESGEGGGVKILEAMQWILDNKDKYDIRVACMSFGSKPQKNDPLERGVEALVASGIVVVTASGNNGREVLSPATARATISVGALNKNLEIADFTSRSVVRGVRKPEFYAPGENVLGLSNTGGETIMSGTSVACPYIAGLCFNICNIYKNIPPFLVKKTLFSNAKRRGGIFYYSK